MVIGVGTRYTDFTTASKWLFKDTCKFVNINVSEFQALKMDAVPVVADAKDALPRLLAKLDGYKAPYTTEVSAAREKWAKELERLDHITFEDKKSWKPIINDANADSAKRFAKDLDAGLCQTTVLGAINARFFSEFEIPPLSILQQQKIAELHLLAKKETALLRQLSAEKERYYDLLIRNVHSIMK